MLHRFIFVKLSKRRYQGRQRERHFGTGNAGSPSEELVEIQALSVDLREAVMACLSGRESCRWTVLELLERLKKLRRSRLPRQRDGRAGRTGAGA